jgi:hypothetical protein
MLEDGRGRGGNRLSPSDLLIFLFLSLLSEACGGATALHAPNVVQSLAREPTQVSLDPIASGAHVQDDFAPPGPAAVLTAAMAQELAGRALTGGEPGGYQVRCRLDRFATRSETSLTESEQTVVLYADLSCEARRAPDGAAVWRGELRGRACQRGRNVLASSTGVQATLVDRAFSDVAREMASDLAVRALALRAQPSTRAFADEDQQRSASGLDDSPWGTAALSEMPAGVERAMRSLDPHDATMRAAAWNVVALAVGPGDAWPTAEKVALDPDALVRFVQYKALARLGSAGAMAQLRAALPAESDGLLAEMLRDVIASGGIGVARSRR